MHRPSLCLHSYVLLSSFDLLALPLPRQRRVYFVPFCSRENSLDGPQPLSIAVFFFHSPFFTPVTGLAYTLHLLRKRDAISEMDKRGDRNLLDVSLTPLIRTNIGMEVTRKIKCRRVDGQFYIVPDRAK